LCSDRRLRGIATAVLLGAAAMGLTAGASRADAAVTAGRTMEAWIGSNMVNLDAYPADTDVVVTRNGVEIARATDVVGAGGAASVNHDQCFDTVTPDILPGDVIEAHSPGDATPDTLLVRDIFLDHDALQAAVPDLTNSVPVTGRVFEAGSYALQFRTGPDRQNETLNLAAGPFNRTVTLDAGLPWPPGETTLEWASGGELVVSDGEGGAGPGCPAFAQSSAVASDTLLGQGENLVISGAAAAGITPNVAINGGGGTPATVAGGVWSMPIAAAQLVEGANSIEVTFAGPGGPPAKSFSVTKDTIAPAAAPNASPAGGTYFDPQSVTLNGVEGGGRAYYTTDGSDPTTASTPYTGPIAITSSQTLKVVQYDAAGNRGPVASHAYVITAPPAPPAPPQQQQAPQPQQQIVLIAPPRLNAESANTLTVAALRLRGTRSLRTLRRNGLRFGLRTSSSTRFLLVRLIRVTGSGRRTKRSVIQEREFRLRSGGSYAGRLRIGKRTKTGRYELAIAAAGADEEYAGFTRTAFRLTR
jgi:hypothetical protein